MIICICRRINAAGVQDAIEAGARSPEAVQAFHGCEFKCGRCRPSMGEMISEHMDSMPPEERLVAAE